MDMISLLRCVKQEENIRLLQRNKHYTTNWLLCAMKLSGTMFSPVQITSFAIRLQFQKTRLQMQEIGLFKRGLFFTNRAKAKDNFRHTPLQLNFQLPQNLIPILVPILVPLLVPLGR